MSMSSLFIYSDGLASRLVYEALEKDDWQKLWKLDRMLMVQNLPRETGEKGTQRIGERMLSLVESLYDIPFLFDLSRAIRKSNHLVIQRLSLRLSVII